MSPLSAPAALRLDRPRRRRAAARGPARVVCLPTVAAKRCGGPEDRALYTCGCGYAFHADVSTSVGCPHCGCEQAW